MMSCADMLKHKFVLNFFKFHQTKLWNIARAQENTAKTLSGEGPTKSNFYK